MDANRILSKLALSVNRFVMSALFVAFAVAGLSAGTARGQSNQDSNVPTRLTRQPDFMIPFHVAEDSREIAEVHLFVSVDQGRDWQRYDRQLPTARGFQFRANDDGEYWFAVRTIDSRGQLTTDEPWQPGLVVIVDTQLPRFDLRVNVDSTGQAIASWTARDPNLAPQTLRLQFQDRDGNWRDVQVRAPDERRDSLQDWSDEAQWWIRSPGTEVVVRAEILDRAGNSTRVNKRVAIANMANQQSRPSPFQTQPFQQASAGPDNRATAGRNFRSNGLGDNSGRSNAFENDRFGNNGDRNNRFGNNQRPATEDRPGSSTWNNFTSGINSLLGGVQHSNATHGAADVAELQRPLRSRSEREQQYVASRHSFSGDANSPFSSVQPPANQNTQPATSPIFGSVSKQRPQGFQTPSAVRPRISGSPNFALDYEVFDVGPQGPDKVELWYTRDQGRTWELYGSDRDRRSPMEVQLKSEGLYGFMLLVHDQGSTPPKPPRDGDEADMWVGVDWTKPVGRITRATESGQAATGQLANGTGGEIVIDWTAEDTLLDETPISLSYSDSSEGPWTPIATNLHNSGSHRWRVDRRLPRRVYLQLTVKDLAGNVITDVYDMANGSSGQRPRGRIRDIQPLRQTTFRPSFRR